MDEGKAPGPKPKWWSRPSAGRPAAPSSDHVPRSAPGGPSQPPTAPEAQDAGVRPVTGAFEGTPAGDTLPSTAAPESDVSGARPVERTTDAVEAAEAAPEDAVPDTAASGTTVSMDAVPTDSLPTESVPADFSATDSVATDSVATAPASTEPVRAEAEAAAHEAPAADAVPSAPAEPRAQRPKPLHAPDPYGTPPYGDPGPWAPAPPVQRPSVTPAHGTQLPPGAHQAPAPAPHPGMTPPHGTQLPPPAPVLHQPQPAPHAGMTPAHGTQLPPPAPAPVPVPAPLPAPGVVDPVAPTAAQSRWMSYDPWSAPRMAAPAGPAEGAGRPRRRGLLVTGALLIALVAGGVGGGIGAYMERNGGISGDGVELSQPPAEKGPRDPESVAGIAASALPGVVTIHVGGGSEEATGTGFVLDAKGHILTNNHVVEGARSNGDISVTFNGGEVARASIVGGDGGYDLAVIKVDGVSGLRPLPLGNSDSVRVGDPVVAIGAPYNLAGTVTAGIISARERPITAGGEKADGSDVSYVDALQTDAPINPGNSGGPLMDSKARVIGINSAIRAADDGGGLGGGQGGSIGLGFAIPINQGKRVAEELINTGRATHPVIGVTLDTGYAGDGARVETKTDGGEPVKPGGPADRAGVRPGDVITEVDGVRVHSGRELIVKIRGHRPGDRLELTLERDGRERTVSLTLGTAGG
ncbi:trypsin-like peptidase domain-containing protein [Streptomyces sp. LX-29]|uniref:S1C family serine protease n=1 Tax=Streptomyces sp. LX-29 TaxID=2900152 RepID=UPI00240E6A4F|nr:trypsin-like peptidase domain-containing protein [Streptomyces sp. LX-29]WFB07564.1 trypsin-like peptidase domain-containing protein [Streptomyces sp. LX-29]